VHGARAASPGVAAHDQPHESRSRLRSRLLRQHRAADAHRRRAEELLRLRGNQRHARAAPGLKPLPEGARVSFAVRLDSALQALHRRLRMALAAFALAASSFALAFAEPAQRGWIALASLACFAFAFGRARLAARRHPGSRRGSRAWLGAASPATGRLSIDDTGNASWTDGIEAAGG